MIMFGRLAAQDEIYFC